MENKRKEVVRGNENAYIADNTELAYSIHVVVKASSQNFNRLLSKSHFMVTALGHGKPS